MTNYLATTSEHMAQFQYVWHNIWANVLLKFKTTKLFKHALKVIPENLLIRENKIIFLKLTQKNSNRKLINSLYRKLVKIYEIKRVKSCLILTVIPSNNVTIGKYQ